MALVKTLKYNKWQAEDTTNILLNAGASVDQGSAINTVGALCAAASADLFLGIIPQDCDDANNVRVVNRDGAVVPALIAASQTIVAGDPLTISATDGYLSKAATTNHIVAYAVESATTGAGESALIPVRLAKTIKI